MSLYYVWKICGLFSIFKTLHRHPFRYDHMVDRFLVYTSSTALSSAALLMCQHYLLKYLVFLKLYIYIYMYICMYICLCICICVFVYVIRSLLTCPLPSLISTLCILFYLVFCCYNWKVRYLCFMFVLHQLTITPASLSSCSLPYQAALNFFFF